MDTDTGQRSSDVNEEASIKNMDGTHEEGKEKEKSQKRKNTISTFQNLSCYLGNLAGEIARQSCKSTQRRAQNQKLSEIIASASTKAEELEEEIKYLETSLAKEKAGRLAAESSLASLTETVGQTALQTSRSITDAFSGSLTMSLGDALRGFLPQAVGEIKKVLVEELSTSANLLCSFLPKSPLSPVQRVNKRAKTKESARGREKDNTTSHQKAHPVKKVHIQENRDSDQSELSDMEILEVKEDEDDEQELQEPLSKEQEETQNWKTHSRKINKKKKKSSAAGHSKEGQHTENVKESNPPLNTPKSKNTISKTLVVLSKNQKGEGKWLLQQLEKLELPADLPVANIRAGKYCVNITCANDNDAKQVRSVLEDNENFTINAVVEDKRPPQTKIHITQVPENCGEAEMRIKLKQALPLNLMLPAEIRLSSFPSGNGMRKWTVWLPPKDARMLLAQKRLFFGLRSS